MTGPATTGTATTGVGLTVRWPGGELLLEPAGALGIGRDPQNAVVIDSPAVSRHHATLEHRGGAWSYVDLGSTQGSYVRGSTVAELTIGDDTVLRLGRGPDAVVIELCPQTPLPAEAAASSTTTPTAPSPGTAGSLRVQAGRAGRVLRPGQRLEVGRDQANDLVLDHETVSRRHLLVEQVDGRWTVRDLGSSSGTWRDGERVDTEPVRSGATYTLGDPAAGQQLTLTADGQAEAGSPPSPGSAAGAVPGAFPQTFPRALRVPVAVGAGLLLVAGAALAVTRPWSAEPAELLVTDLRLVSGSSTPVQAGCATAGPRDVGPLAMAVAYTGLPGGSTRLVARITATPAGAQGPVLVGEAKTPTTGLDLPEKGCATLTFTVSDVTPAPGTGYTLELAVGDPARRAASVPFDIGSDGLHTR